MIAWGTVFASMASAYARTGGVGPTAQIGFAPARSWARGATFPRAQTVATAKDCASRARASAGSSKDTIE